MKTRRVFVYGASGHGKVVADILISKGETEFAGFVDDREELRGTKVMGFPVVGNGEWLRQEASNSRVAVALGIGESRSRHLLAATLLAMGNRGPDPSPSCCDSVAKRPCLVQGPW